MSTRRRPAHVLPPAQLAALFAGERLAVAHDAEAQIEAGTFATLLDLRAAEKRAGFFDDDSSSSAPCGGFVRDGSVNVVTIRGMLMQDGGGWWLDGHAAIRQRIESAVADGPRVLALRIDSPGGVVAGCFDAVRACVATLADSGIPCMVWCGGQGAFSGGYAWACVGSSISVPDTGGVGSVGVMGKLRDSTKANEMSGDLVAVIRSGSMKCEGDPDIKTTTDAVAREQEVCDAMAAIFAAVVNDARKLGVDKILEAQGRCFYGAAAVTAGFADHVESFDAFMARCQARAEEQDMKALKAAIAGRVGLAEDVSDERVMQVFEETIAAHEAKAKTERERAAAVEAERAKIASERDALAGEFAAYVCADALISAKGTVATIESTKALVAGQPPALAARALRDHFAAVARGSALPAETKAPLDAPQTRGPSATAAQGLDFATAKGGDLTTSQLAEAYGSPHFDRLVREHGAAQAKSDAGQFARVNTNIAAQS